MFVLSSLDIPHVSLRCEQDFLSSKEQDEEAAAVLQLLPRFLHLSLSFIQVGIGQPILSNHELHSYRLFE